MSEIVATLVARLIEAGSAPAIAAAVVAEAYAAGAAAGLAASADANAVILAEAAAVMETAAAGRSRREINARYYAENRDEILAKRAARKPPPAKARRAAKPATEDATTDLLGAELDAKGRPKKAERRGEFLRTDWKPSPADIQFAHDKGMTAERIASSAATFRDYWLARGGNIAAKRDWSATWRNWVRSEIERRGTAATAPGKPAANGFASLAREFMARAQENQQEKGADDGDKDSADEFDFDDGRTIEGTVAGRA